MTFAPELLIGFLPFWIVNYGLALVAWSCIARFGMQSFMAPDSPNYIWRAFRFLTDWWLALVRAVTPLYVSPVFHPLIGALWAFGIRFAATLAMFALGLAPRLSQMQPG